VDDAVVTDDEFAYVFAPEFRDNAPGQWEIGQAVCRCDDPGDEFVGSTQGVLADVFVDRLKVRLGAGAPD